jgi:hypothetical protein
VLKARPENVPTSESVSPKADFQAKFTIFLLYGFFFLDKAFVYVASPLTAFLLFDRRIFFDRVYMALTKRGYLSGLTWVLLISTMFGIAEVIYGLLSGYQLTTSLQILAFNFCPWFLFLGIFAGVQRPFLARDYIRFMAYFHAILTPAYYLFLRHLSFTVGGTEIGFAPGSGSLVLLGLFCFETNLARYWFPILICIFDTIAGQIRADWVALGAAVVVWAIATRQTARIFSMAAIIIALFAIGFVADIKIPGLPGRGGEISARDTVGRALSGIDPELAQEYSSNASTYAGTIAWRENWWKAIREIVFQSPQTTVFGLGYGYPIGDLVPYLKNQDIRSPHSVFYFTLAYSGFVGVFLFALLQLQLLRLLWTTFRETGQIFGLAFAIFAAIGAMFGNFFEVPQRAIPTYILYGLCIGPLFLALKEQNLDPDGQNDHTARVQAPYRPANDWPTTPVSAISGLRPTIK